MQTYTVSFKINSINFERGIMKINHKYFILITLCLLASVLSSACNKKDSIYIKNNGDKIESESDETVSEAENETFSQNLTENTGSNIQTGKDKSFSNKISVHICGSVGRPDVYELDEGARIIDAVRAAGGFTENAAGDYINLAKLLSDGERIYIPDIIEAESLAEEGMLNNAAASDTGSGGSLAVSAADSGSKININTADEAELMKLKGIGKARAGDIISYRNTHGNFRNISDIMQVPGIKQAAFDKIKDDICVE